VFIHIKLLLTCTHAHSLSQMCFLKGRTADKHSLSHNVLEFTSGSKGHRSWHHRLLGLPAKTTHDGRLVREKRELFVYNNGTTPTRYSRVVSNFNDVMFQLPTCKFRGCKMMTVGISHCFCIWWYSVPVCLALGVKTFRAYQGCYCPTHS